MPSLGISFFRAFRRKWKLTQPELARLVGALSSAEVASIEREERIPSIRVLFRYMLLFGADFEGLLPQFAAEEQEDFLREAQVRFMELRDDTSRAGKLERELLVLALRRVITHALERRAGSVGGMPTRPLSLRPETPGADQEATNGLKYSRKSPLLGGQ